MTVPAAIESAPAQIYTGFFVYHAHVGRGGVPMTTRRLLQIAVFGVIASSSGGVPVALAQSARPALERPFPDRSLWDRPSFTLPSFLMPRIARPAAKPAEPKPGGDPPPIAFYIATGPANACGPGCDAWIAADGKIDLYAAQRLRKVLTKLGPRKLPLFLHSAGGSVLGAIELGRLARSHNLAVSVARTTPAECPRDESHGIASHGVPGDRAADRAAGDKACETLKRSGQDLASEFESNGAMCNSACVLVLAGGAQRSVPPWVRLGVHAIGIDLGKTTIRGPLLAAATRSANARIVEYLHDMGIPKALFDTSNAVPHESTRFLQRDEVAQFGLDTRDFGETDWRVTDRPTMAIAKGFFLHTGDAGLAYPEALLRLSCGTGKAMRLTFARERPAAIGVDAHPLRISVNGVPVDLPYATQSGRIEVRTTTVWPEAVAAADDRGAIEITGFDAAGGRAPDSRIHDSSPPGSGPHDHVVIGMAGFSAAYAKLRKMCEAAASADSSCSASELSPRCMPEALKTVHPATAGAWPGKGP
jgi:hypothetical protein